MRASLVTSELLLVRALGFDLEVELPFAYCLNVLRGLGSIRYFITDDTKKQSKRHHFPAQKEIWKRMEQGNIDYIHAQKRKGLITIIIDRYGPRDEYNS